MSVAGKREGMKHAEQGDEETTRSGLFYEAIRIIKEMRKATNGEYPKYAVWENVPGAFSSNKGRDFHAALEALCSVCDDTVSIPKPYDTKRIKLVWNKAGEIVGDNYSVAWRTLDAQYWGVPQRRRRIYLVVDFRGERAGQISFEREGLRRDFAKSGTPGQAVAGDATNRTGTDDCGGIGINGDVAATLDASYYKGCGMRQGIEREIVFVPYTLKIRSGCEGGGKGALIQTDKSATLSTMNDQYLFQSVLESAGFKAGQGAKARSIGWGGGSSPSLAAEAGGNTCGLWIPGGISGSGGTT